MSAGRVVLDAETIDRTLSRIAHEIIEGNGDLDDVALIGIHQRGVPLAHRLRRLIAPLKTDYDLVILDCPPSVSLVSENVVHACDVLLVPLIPAVLSVRTFDQLLDFVEKMPGRKPQVLAFLSMVDRRKKAHREFTERLPHDRASVVAETIPNRTVIEQMAQQRAPVPEFAPYRSATTAYEALWARVQSCLTGTG